MINLGVRSINLDLLSFVRKEPSFNPSSIGLTDNSTPLAHPETGPSEVNLFKDKSIVGHNQSPCRQVKPLAGLNKILKFRMATEDEFLPAAVREKETH